MSAGKKNKFVIKEIFENVKAGKEKIGKPEERFGILWKIKLTTKSYWCGALSLQLVCSKPEISENEWSIDTDIVTKIGENKKRTFSKSHTFTQGNMSFYKDVFIDYHEMDKFMTDDNVFVEINVTIKKSIGVDLLPKKLKLFDDDVAKNFSDVVLMVGDQEFHVNKMYLASHSTYFETLFLGNFAESEKSIIELKDIDPDEFQNFLEVLYGESPINDDTVAGILKLADMYDAKTAIRRCEEFLAWYSKSTIKEKFEIAAKYKLNELTKCISEMKIKLVRSEPEGVSLYFRLECLKPECSENEWSINTDIVIKIGESEHCTFAETFSFTHEKMKTVGNSYVYWNDTNKYLTNGKLSVEFTVTINSAIGVDLHSKKRVFDDDVAKESSDVVLIVGDQKFYVSKLYLSFHSTYFKSLFSGSFAESEKSIIELKDIDQNHFQVFLELIHGASLVYDFTVSKILKLADFFDAKTAIERCEEFLLTHSEKSIKDKFEMANKYKLEDLKNVRQQREKFSICHVFNKLSSLNIWEDWHGDVMERFGSKWIIRLLKNGCGDISPDLLCENSETVDWSINTKFDVIVNGKLFETGLQFEFTKNNMETGVSYIRKIDFIKFEIEESVKIEFRVKITEMTGIEEKKSRSFDDDVAKESSDVVLMVGDQKFYVAKLLLTFHSTYFKCLFSGSFSESQKSEIELKDIDPLVFQYFLELIYGISLLNDTIIMDILELADFFDAQIVMERCEEFLLNRSEKPVAVKFQAALKYKMEKLKVKCYSEIKKGTDFHGVSPQNEEDFSKKDWKELFDKVVSFF